MVTKSRLLVAPIWWSQPRLRSQGVLGNIFWRWWPVVSMQLCMSHTWNEGLKIACCVLTFPASFDLVMHSDFSKERRTYRSHCDHQAREKKNHKKCPWPCHCNKTRLHQLKPGAELELGHWGNGRKLRVKMTYKIIWKNRKNWFWDKSSWASPRPDPFLAPPKRLQKNKKSCYSLSRNAAVRGLINLLFFFNEGQEISHQSQKFRFYVQSTN